MKQLIIDHFRRWWWVLGAAALAQIGTGSRIALNPKDDFEFGVLLVAFWAGAMLLQFDFQRGFLRAVAILPLTQQQIGRAWWIATVLIPGVVFPALLFLGAGISWQFSHSSPFPTGRLAMAGLFTTVWFGIISQTSFSSSGFRRSGFHFRPGDLLGYLSSITILGGVLYFQDASKNSLKLRLFVILGVILTVVGWFNANSFNLAGLPALFASQPAARRVRTHKASLGNGGLLYLFQTTWLRIFLIASGMSALVAMITMEGHPLHGSGVKEFLMPMCLFVPIFLVIGAAMPFVGQVRYWRTLPIGPGRLAAMLIAICTLPAVGLAIVLTTVSLLAFGSHDAMLVLETSVISIAPCALASCFIIWQGAGTTALAALTLVMIATFFQVQTVLHGKLPLIWAGLVALGCIAAAFFVARMLLSNSSDVYRVRSVSGRPFGSTPFSWGR